VFSAIGWQGLREVRSLAQLLARVDGAAARRSKQPLFFFAEDFAKRPTPIASSPAAPHRLAKQKEIARRTAAPRGPSNAAPAISALVFRGLFGRAHGFLAEAVGAILFRRDKMLSNLRIKGFRCFEDFEMEKLGRINLLVGANNSGKTSILEALELLILRGDVWHIFDILKRRGELIINDSDFFNKIELEVEIMRLFNFKNINKEFNMEAMEKENDNLWGLKLIFDDRGDKYINILEKHKNYYTNIGDIRLSNFLGFGQEWLKVLYNKREDLPNLACVFTNFISTSQLINYLDDIIITENEEIIIESLKIIDSNIERIAPIHKFMEFNLNNIKGGAVIKTKNHKDRIPIGSMGDGLWRVLCLVLALVRAKDGYLLVDEIDTGLHYTIMDKVWELIYKTAKKLNVQVFATTHSQDCRESLASICDKDREDEIFIHRIEKNKKKSIIYTEGEIIAAAEHNVEVR
jgi:AAA15 family ATPase/GTPase